LNHPDLLKRNGKFYTKDQDFDSWFKVAGIDYLQLIERFPWEHLFKSFSGIPKLLDVGCGTGKFPSLLTQSQVFINPCIIYDYLDPSSYSLFALKKSLRPPFFPGFQYQATIETMPLHQSNRGRYQLIWAIHSLYTLSTEQATPFIDKIRSLLDPKNGIGLIFLAARHSFYISFYERYLQTVSHPRELPSFLDAQRIASTLRTLGIPHEITPMNFFHSIQESDVSTLEQYLSKCTFDSRSVDFWLGHPVLKDHLQSFTSKGWYRFPQEVWLIQFKGKGDSSKHASTNPPHPDITKT